MADIPPNDGAPGYDNYAFRICPGAELFGVLDEMSRAGVPGMSLASGFAPFVAPDEPLREAADAVARDEARYLSSIRPPGDLGLLSMLASIPEALRPAMNADAASVQRAHERWVTTLKPKRLKGNRGACLHAAYLRDVIGAPIDQVAGRLHVVGTEDAYGKRRYRIDAALNDGRATAHELRLWPWVVFDHGRLPDRWWELDQLSWLLSHLMQLAAEEAEREAASALARAGRISALAADIHPGSYTPGADLAA